MDIFVTLQKTITMTTITINERTKAGKTLLELAKMLSATNKGVTIDTGLNAPVAKNKLLADFETSCKQLKESRLRKIKRKSLDELLHEK